MDKENKKTIQDLIKDGWSTQDVYFRLIFNSDENSLVSKEEKNNVKVTLDGLDFLKSKINEQIEKNEIDKEFGSTVLLEIEYKKSNIKKSIQDLINVYKWSVLDIGNALLMKDNSNIDLTLEGLDFLESELTELLKQNKISPKLASLIDDKILEEQCKLQNKKYLSIKPGEEKDKKETVEEYDDAKKESEKINQDKFVKIDEVTQKNDWSNFEGEVFHLTKFQKIKYFVNNLFIKFSSFFKNPKLTNKSLADSISKLQHLINQYNADLVKYFMSNIKWSEDKNFKVYEEYMQGRKKETAYRVSEHRRPSFTRVDSGNFKKVLEEVAEEWPNKEDLNRSVPISQKIRKNQESDSLYQFLKRKSEGVKSIFEVKNGQKSSDS